MLVRSSLRIPAICLATVLAFVAPSPASADFQLACPQNGDAMGWAVAADGDANGDGVNDIVIGAPCAWNGSVRRAGRMLVISGATGKRLMQRRGEQEDQFFGASVAFLPGRGAKAKVVVGSPGWDGLDGGTTLTNSGRVDVYRRGLPKRFEVFGTDRQGGLGESLIALPAADGVSHDLAIGASNHRDLSGNRKGALFIVSGIDGSEISVRYGEKVNSGFSRQLAVLPDVDGEGLARLAVGSQDLNFNGVLNRGSADVVSVVDISASMPGFPIYGAKGDRLGSALAPAGDVDGDDLIDLLVGSPRADDTGLTEAGVATVTTASGDAVFSFADPELQEKAHFGAAVANTGDVDGDEIEDFAAGAPEFDRFDGGFSATDAGRVVVVSGSDGTPIWSTNGIKPGAALGQALASTDDFKGRGVGALVAGAPGDAPRGRRGAGKASIFSSDTGAALRHVRGRRGQETRIYVAGNGSSGATVKSYRAVNSTRGPSTRLTGFSAAYAMTVAVVGDDGVGVPGMIQLASANGPGSASSEIIISNAASSNRIEQRFNAFDDAVLGVNVAAGQLLGLDREQLVAVEAAVVGGMEPGDGDVRVRAFDRLDLGTAWFPYSEFVAFGADDTIVCEQTSIEQPINATGATVAVGDVFGDPKDGIEEIVVGAADGISVVRVFSSAGELLAEWCAFEPVAGIGVQVGIIDVPNNDGEQVLTVRMLESPEIRVYTGTGEAVTVPGNPNDIPIVIDGTVLDLVGAIGGYAQGADVDYDGTQEIVFVAGGTDHPVILGVELDGTLSEGFDPIEAFPTFGASGLVGLAVTDRFINK